MQLLDICSSKKDHHQQKMCMEPYPPNTMLIKQQEQQVKKIIHHTSKINSQNDFRTFHRNFIWEKTHNNLLLKDSHYFSLKGIRLLTQFLAEITGKK